MSTSATASGSTIAVQAHEGGSIGEMIISAVGRYPQRVAFIDGDRSITYTELGRLIGKAMAAFRSLGLQHGDGVIQLSGNRVEVFVVMAAAYLLGLRSVTLHATYCALRSSSRRLKCGLKSKARMIATRAKRA